MHRYSNIKKHLCIGLSALSLVACGGGGSDDNSKLNLSLLISGGIKSNGLMLQNTAKGADNTPFAVAKTTASTLDITNKIAQGSDYDIKVVKQPEGFGQYCYIEQGKGTFTNTDIAIQLKCVAGAAKVSTYAGTKAPGRVNGSRLSAQFKYPAHIVFDSKGNLFIADAGSYQIRKVTPKGVVSLFAGSSAAGSADGTGGGASFKFPFAITIDKDDNLYVGSSGCVRKITPNRKVTTLAGECGNTTANSKPAAADFTSKNTTGTAARFQDIYGIVYDGDNALYVFDSNYIIRKVSINDGTSANARVQNIIALVNAYVSMGLSADKKYLYYISSSDFKLYQVDLTSTAQPKTATALTTTTADKGFKNGDFSVAQFDTRLNQIIASKSGQFLYLAEYNNTRIRRIDLINKMVSTLAGSGTNAVTDDTGTNAAFKSPKGIAQDAQGNLFVSSEGHVIRKLELVKQP